MVDQIAVVTFTTPASGDAALFDVTHPSITGAFSCALFIYAGSTTDSTDVANGLLGMGACSVEGTGDAGKNHSYCAQGSNASLNVPDYNTSRFNSRCIHVVDGTNVNTTVVLAKFDSAISGGVRLNFTTRTIQVKVTAILFSIPHSGIARPSASASSNEDVGDSPFFRPSCLIAFGGGGADGTDSTDAEINIGFAIDAGGVPQVSSFVDLDDATEPSDADGEVTTAFAWASMFTTRTAARATVSSFDSQGYTWGPDSVTTLQAMVLALQFGSAVRIACASMAVSGSTGPQAFNAFGFTPDIVIGQSTLIAASATPTDGPTAAATGLFVTGRYGSRAYTFHGEEGKTNGAAAPFNTHHRQEDVAVLTYNHTGGIAQRATWIGASGSGGFVLDFSVATAGFLTAIGIQIIPNPPLPGRRIRRRVRLWKRARSRLQLVAGHAASPITLRLPRRPMRRARLMRRLRRPSIGGKPIGNPPLMRGFWKAVGRIRRAMMLRLRPRPLAMTSIPVIGETLPEAPKGRLSQPGLVRGRIVGAEAGASDNA